MFVRVSVAYLLASLRSLSAKDSELALSKSKSDRLLTVVVTAIGDVAIVDRLTFLSSSVTDRPASLTDGTVVVVDADAVDVPEVVSILVVAPLSAWILLFSKLKLLRI